jgi:hypothetical protein
MFRIWLPLLFSAYVFIASETSLSDVDDFPEDKELLEEEIKAY